MTASETLELGKRLIADFNEEESRDTLLRWMVHRIAELMKAAEESSGADRPQRLDEAAKAILELWDYRSTLRTIDPLADLSPILRVIRSLEHDNNPWWPRPPSQLGTAVSEVYSSFRSLIVSFLVGRGGGDAVPMTNARFLAEDEIEIRLSIENWLTEYQRKVLSGELRLPKTRKAKPVAESDPKAFLLEQIQDARNALDDLERAVEGKPPIKRPNRYESYIRTIAADTDHGSTT